MLETLEEMYLNDEDRPTHEVDSKYLSVVFNDFFNTLHQKVSAYTVTLNEYAYLCLFLYPHYMERVYLEHSKINNGANQEERKVIEKNMNDLVNNRGS